MTGNLYRFRELIMEDFKDKEFKHPESMSAAELSADENRNRLFKSFFVWTEGLGLPRENVFNDWWKNKGKKLAKNIYGEDIFSIKGNLYKDRYQENEKALKQLEHEYLVNAQETIADNPILVSEPYMLPVGSETPAKKLADNIYRRNQFQGYYTNFKQQNRVDNIKMAIIEEVLNKFPSKTDAILAEFPQNELPRLSIKSTNKIAKLVRSDVKDLELLREKGQAILRKDKEHRTKV